VLKAYAAGLFGASLAVILVAGIWFVAQPSREPGLEWGGKVYSSKQEFQGYLKAKGLSYKAWVARNPGAAPWEPQEVRAAPASTSETSRPAMPRTDQAGEHWAPRLALAAAGFAIGLMLLASGWALGSLLQGTPGAALAAAIARRTRRVSPPRRAGEARKNLETAGVEQPTRQIESAVAGVGFSAPVAAPLVRVTPVKADPLPVEAVSPQHRSEQQVEQACEIQWWRGYLKGQFYVEGDRTVASRAVRASGIDAPQQSDAAVAAYEALVTELVSAGWERDGRGAHWFSERFRRRGLVPAREHELEVESDEETAGAGSAEPESGRALLEQPLLDPVIESGAAGLGRPAELDAAGRPEGGAIDEMGSSPGGGSSLLLGALRKLWRARRSGREPARLSRLLSGRAGLRSALSHEDDSPVRHARGVPIREIVRRFWPFARPYRFWLCVSFVFTLLVPAIAAAQIWMFKLVIDEVLVPKDFGPFVWIAAVYFALTILAGIVSFADSYVSVWIGERFLLELRTSVFRHVQGLSLEFFARMRLGDVLARLTGDVAAIETFVLSGVTRAVAYTAQIAIFAGVLLYLQWQLALPALIVVPLVWLVARYFTRLIKQASREKRRSSGSLSAVAEESLANAELVQAYDRLQTEVDRFHRQNVAVFEAELAATRIKAVFSPVLDVMKIALALCVIGLGTWSLQNGQLTLGGLIVFLTYLGMLYSPIKGASRLTSSLYAATAGAERIIEVLDEQPAVLDKHQGQPLVRAEGRVEFENVSFRYPRGDRAALSDISLRLRPGETVALVGRSGAGKSTLAKLLLRFYDPAGGSIRLDDIDLRELSLESLRANIALVLQETLVFDGTIRENIAYGKPGASERDIFRAALHADADEFISRLPDGYETLIGQRGRRLSGGQAQRVAIARAMIRDAPLLILDEPTTGLDAESAQRILSPLRRLMSGRTTIVITHNLLTIHEADTIIVLDEGKIVESGPHAELLARGGTYSELYRLHQPPELQTHLSAVEEV